MATSSNSARPPRTESIADDVSVKPIYEPFGEGELYRRYKHRVLDSDNDFIVVIAAASKSAISGVGKSTLAAEFCRTFDASTVGWSAEQKATLNPQRFAHGLLADEESIQNQSAVMFDEMQGTLSSRGTDSRRSMADSVIDVSAALSTLRFRQCTAVLVTQSTKWIDKRIDDILDALVLVQQQDPVTGEVQAEVFDTYYNDLELSPSRYTERIDTITWSPLPDDDPDYAALHEMKKQSATNQASEAEDEDGEDELKVPKEKQIEIAQELRNEGIIAEKIASKPFIEYGQDWVYKHTEAPSE